MTVKKFKQTSKIIICLCIILVNANVKYPALEEARKLNAPNPTSTTNGEMEEAEFWENNAELIRQAWNQWENHSSSVSLNEELNWNGKLSAIINETLFEAIGLAHDNPWKETDLKSLWKEVAPGVHATQLLQSDKIHLLRKYLNSISKSGIPTRRPNGMNRYGYILEPSINGSALVSPLNNFYRNLAADILRPVGRTFFPEYYSIHDNNDEESYAFTIRYRENEDVSLNEHSDASLVTLNININLPGEESSYDDSENDNSPQIYFVDDNGQRYNVSFTPGMALLHRGIIKHAAYPIQSGVRTNLVIWLFGTDGYVRVKPYEKSSERMNIFDRSSSSFDDRGTGSLLEEKSDL